MARRAATSALLGSAVEYFDFTLFATASALFLGPVFFAPLGPLQATLAAFITFGSAFVARPLGAVVFGHVGDRVGRRTALIWSVTLMGLATTAIGLLPGYATARRDGARSCCWCCGCCRVSRPAESRPGRTRCPSSTRPVARGTAIAAWTMQGTSLGTLLGKLPSSRCVWLPQPTPAGLGLAAAASWWPARSCWSAVADPPDGDGAAARSRQLAAAGGLAAGAARRGVQPALAAACSWSRSASLFAVGGAVLNVYGLSYATARGTSAGGYLAMISARHRARPRPASRSGRGCRTGSAGVRCSSARASPRPRSTSPTCRRSASGTCGLIGRWLPAADAGCRGAARRTRSARAWFASCSRPAGALHRRGASGGQLGMIVGRRSRPRS